MKEHRTGTGAEAPPPDERRAPSRLALAGGGHVGYRFLPGRAPTVVFLCGYASEMTGTKARFLHRLCAGSGHAYRPSGLRNPAWRRRSLAGPFRPLRPFRPGRPWRARCPVP